MKILYLAASFLPSESANSIQVMKMCNAMSKDHQVTLLAHRGVAFQDYSELQAMYGIDGRFSILFYPNPRIKGKRFLQRAYLVTTLLRLQPDLIIGRDMRACLAGAQLGFPTAVELHAHVKDHSESYALVIEKLIRHKNLNKIFVTSTSLKQALCNDYKLADGLVTLLHNGADFVFLDSTKQDSLDNNFFHVGYIGHLYPGKGMEVISKLVERCPWAYFHIVGGKENDISYWKTQLKSCQNLEFYGFVPHQKTERYRQAMDVLLLPYQKQVYYMNSDAPKDGRWINPLKLYEYMASGKPIIASRIEIAEEILTHQKNALLCQPDDIDQWVDALLLLKEDEALRKKLGQEAKAKFERELTWEKRAAKLVENINIS